MERVEKLEKSKFIRELVISLILTLDMHSMYWSIKDILASSLQIYFLMVLLLDVFYSYRVLYTEHSKNQKLYFSVGSLKTAR